MDHVDPSTIGPGGATVGGHSACSLRPDLGTITLVRDLSGAEGAATCPTVCSFPGGDTASTPTRDSFEGLKRANCECQYGRNKGSACV